MYNRGENYKTTMFGFLRIGKKFEKSVLTDRMEVGFSLNTRPKRAENMSG